MAAKTVSNECPLARAGLEVARIGPALRAIDAEIQRTKERYVRDLEAESSYLDDRMSAVIEAATWDEPATIEGLAVVIMLMVHGSEDLHIGGADEGERNLRAVRRMGGAALRFLAERHAVEAKRFGQDVMAPDSLDVMARVETRLGGRV